MNLRRAIVFAACVLAPAGPAAAQSPWPQQPQQQTQAPWPAQPQQQSQAPWPQQQPGQAPWPQQQPPQQPQQPQQEVPACAKEFFKLRDETEKNGNAIQEAGKRKVPPPVACRLFNAFVSAEAKMIKYATAKAAECGIPAQAITQMKQSHAKSTEIRTRVCRVAEAGPPRPQAPSLSDALNTPVPDSANIKTGRGTYDTLTGTPLGK